MVAGIILASGYSKRMKRDKLLLKFQNKPAVENVIIAAKTSKLESVILVHRRDRIRLIGEKHQIYTVKNDKAFLGQAESVKLGVKRAGHVDAYLFLTGDQPLISPQFIDKIIDGFKTSKKGIVIPTYNKCIKMPILFSSKYKEDLLSTQGERGGYEIIEKNPQDILYIEANSFYEVADFDNYEEYTSFMCDDKGNKI